MPPLARAPGEDVAPIAEALLRARSPGTASGALPRGRWRCSSRGCERYGWPGNVRELENVLERVAVLYSHRTAAAGGIEPDELRAVLPELFQAPDAPDDGDLRSARGAQEAAVIQRVLGECGGNMTEAAKRLGVGRIDALPQAEGTGLIRACSPMRCWSSA